jgi:hypothetical protein
MSISKFQHHNGCERLLLTSFTKNITHFEENDLLGCDAVKFGESKTLRINLSPPFSGPKSKPSNEQAKAGGRANYYRTRKFITVFIKAYSIYFNQVRPFILHLFKILTHPKIYFLSKFNG